MLIDWFTVIAQIINFLILIFLLNRFLYKPITKTMGERKKKLEAHWQEAQKQREEAQREAQLYRQKQQELEDQQNVLMAQATENAERSHKELIRQARYEVEQLQARWQEAIEQEQEAFLLNLRQKVAEQTCAITRRALRDLANAELEKQAIALFIKRLQNLDENERKIISKSIDQNQEDIIVRSSFELTPEQCKNIVNILLGKQHSSNNKKIQFIVSKEMILGIEIELLDHKIAWSINNYMEHLYQYFQQVLKEEKK